MNLTRSATLRLIRLGSAGLLGLLIIGYIIWRSLNYARGPEIIIISPADGAAIASSSVTITGRAERVTSLLLNGNALSMDEQGYFAESIVVFPGLNILTFVGNDQFGRSIKTSRSLVGL